MEQLKLFYNEIIYGGVIRNYYHHYTGTGIDDGKRTDDVLYYSTNKYPNYTLSDDTLEKIIKGE